jgi:hypothetical protein
MLNNYTRDKVMHQFKRHSENITTTHGLNNNNYTLDDEKYGVEDAGDELSLEEKKVHNRLEIVFRATDKFEKVSTNMKIKDEDICIYSIKNIHDKPFLVYVLHNHTNELHWLSVKNYKDKTVGALHHTLKKEFNKNIILKGKNSNKESHQLWFELVDDDIVLEHMKRSQKYIQCLVSEIVNQKKYLNINISNNIIHFLLYHPDFIFLFNEENKKYEIPEIGYYGNYYKKIALVAAIGLKRQSPFASVGSYYYFAGYGRAMRYAVKTPNPRPMRINGKLITTDESGTYTKGGIVRFALFLGKSTCLLSRKNDKDDTSVLSKNLKESKKYQINGRDGDGKWTQNYDSIHLGKRKYNSKTNPEGVMLYPQTTIKSFEQQLQLSYYYVDTSQKIIDNNYSRIFVE